MISLGNEIGRLYASESDRAASSSRVVSVGKSARSLRI
jgi:hypothetical protein